MDDSLTVGGATGLLNAAFEPEPVQSQADVEPVPDVRSEPVREPTAPNAPRTTSHTEFDPATQSIVFRIVSEMSGTVVTQLPTEVQLRIREYVATADAARQTGPQGGKKA